MENNCATTIALFRITSQNQGSAYLVESSVEELSNYEVQDDVSEERHSDTGRSGNISRLSQSVKNVDELNQFIRSVSQDADYACLLDASLDVSLQAIGSMARILGLTDKHAAISPRCDRAPFCAVKGIAPDTELSEVGQAFLDNLQEYSVVPFATSLCLVVKTKVLFNFGFLESFQNDVELAVWEFCMRINQYGYSSLIYNRYYARGSYDSGASQYQARIDALDTVYPYASYLVDEYFLIRVDPLEKFSELLCVADRQKKILFDFYVMPPIHNGTFEFQYYLLKYFSELCNEKFCLYARVNENALSAHGLTKEFPTIQFAESFDEVFDIGISATQPCHKNQIEYMEDRCLRIVFSVLDIIMCRSDYIRKEDGLRDLLSKVGYEVSDAIITISDFSLEDFSHYYYLQSKDPESKFERIYISSDCPARSVYDSSELDLLPFDSYVLIAGNGYKHKVLPETIEHLSGTNRNYVVIGLAIDASQTGNVIGYPSGGLSDAFLNLLYDNCSCLVFPSVYEGFGLPIAMAMKKGKPVVAYNNMVNNELKRYFKASDEQFVLFDRFEEIDQCIDACVNNPASEAATQSIPTWKDAIIDIVGLVESLLAKSIDYSRIHDRKFLIDVLRYANKNVAFHPKEIENPPEPTHEEAATPQPEPEASRLKTKVKNQVKVRFPRTFNLLKKVLKR